MAEVLRCHVFALPDLAMGGPNGGAPRGPIAGGLHGGGAPHFAMGGPHGGGGPHGTPLRLGTRSRHGRRAPRGAPLHGGRQRQIRGSVPSHGARVLEVRIHLLPRESLQTFGSSCYWAARGVDERPVRADRIRKSIGAENTFPADLLTYETARDALREIIDKVWGYCERSGIRGRTVTLKVKFANFRQITRSRTGQTQIKTRSELEELANALLEPLFPVAKGVRLLGVSLSSLAGREG